MSEYRSEGNDEVQESRRRFLKAGVVAAPLLMTLAARPARAQEVATGSLGVNGSGVATSGPAAPTGATGTDSFSTL